MFVESNNCREIYNNFLLNDKELPTGDKFERLVYLTLQLFDNPKGNSVYKNIFDMSNENNFVSGNAVCVTVTPAQHKLLQLITPIEASDFYKALKHVHYTATYCVEVDFVIPYKHGYVHQILDAIQAIAQETTINNLKTALS